MLKLHSLDRRILRNWLPLAFVCTVLIGFTYAAFQQTLRQTANDPQIQLAEDIAANFADGSSTVENFSNFQRVDIRSSLATFATVFDDNGKVTATSGHLGAVDPSLPNGVFTYTKAHGEDRITWQPAAGVRIAAVVTTFRTPSGTSGFVLVGRNLREVESRDSQLLIVSAVAWAVTLGGSLALRIIITPKR